MYQWLDSVYSDGSKYYISNPYPVKGETISIRLRMLENTEITNVLLRTKEFGMERLYTMEILKKERGLLYFTCDVTVQETRLQYQFYLVTKEGIYYYTQYRITDYIPEESRDFTILVDYQRPDWMKKAVFYQIFPERFCNGQPELSVKDGEYTYQGHKAIQVKEWNKPALTWEEGHGVDFYGGDLYGILEQLDYLQQLGITAIYLNPIFVSPSVHKYDCIDFYHVDPHLGGDAALAKLAEELHIRNMKLILDISINHTSSAGEWFNRENEFYEKEVGAYQNKEAIERDFYFFDKENRYDTWVGVQTMPKLNYTSEELRNRIYKSSNSVLKKWIQAPYHIDGWRFDVADCMARNETIDLYHEVWREIRQELKKERPDILILAEDWSDCAGMFQGEEWDSAMNYFGCTRPIREFLGETDLFHARNEILRKVPVRMSARQLKNRILSYYSIIPGGIWNQLFNLLGSHDIARLHNNTQIHPEEYRGAVIMLFTLPGTPSIYYGDEILLAGRITDNEGFRYPMDWSKALSKEKEENYWLYQKLALLRQSSEALSDGGFIVVCEEGYVFAFARFTETELILVICSTDSKEQEIILPLKNFGIKDISMQEDYFGVQICAKAEEGMLKLNVLAHQSYLLQINLT
ncbi:alpha-glycosidase [Anaerocolumna cellulosilytica]|uniref:Alpha-glycosidase n=1 Tax=Anaerocolumna cellulosilytica TaxID=433286 RepID=A0A6S6QNC8_9FIRM|nr:alpha amylase N-terminal ig-like domain-containing protein [Anaerocolumna cellulosilytica]MBB5195801.1 alpha-glucosidase [Anaerocolumna cellulosilytica]BCJ92863.1 alpha-glycosidase [Anaerocolumna cellulosilytica]